jgi:hypothetical protein
MATSSKRYIAHAGLPRDLKLRIAFIAFRYMIYVLLGTAFEVALYPGARAGREIPVLKYLFQFNWQVDPRLGLSGPWHTPLEVMFGQSSLWMLPVYALSALAIELVYRGGLFNRPLWVRAPLYGLIVMAAELVTGLVVKAITGYAIWMYVDRGNVMHMTSFYIFPLWMGAGLLTERIYSELMDPGLRARLQDELDRPSSDAAAAQKPGASIAAMRSGDVTP